MLIERGDAELWLPEADGERFVGLIGPTKAPEAREKWVVFIGRSPRDGWFPMENLKIQMDDVGVPSFQGLPSGSL